MLKIDYFNKIDSPISLLFINKIAKLTGSVVKKLHGQAEIIVIGDKEMAEINRAHRGKNKTTDVLSFAFLEDKKIKTQYLGQIFISFPQIKKQAKQYGVSIKEEFSRMLVHGLLHLAGYDHDSLKKEKKMFSLQEKIVKKIV